MKKLTCLLLSLLIVIDLFSREDTFVRSDESRGTVYINTPNAKTFPLVAYIDGSFPQSVKNNFNALSYLFAQKNIGLFAIEKRGMSEKEIDVAEFEAFDCYENRLSDYAQVVRELRESVPAWDGRLILIGSSEGGKIAPKLSLLFKEKVAGVVLIGSGGGISFGDEIKYQIKQIARANNPDYDETWLETKINEKFKEILSSPHSLNQYYEKTHKWYSYYLKYDLLSDLLQIDAPILMIHGALDTHIPVASADQVKMAFDLNNKGNLTYCRDEDLGHSISKRIDIFLLILQWAEEGLTIQPAVGF